MALKLYRKFVTEVEDYLDELGLTKNRNGNSPFSSKDYQEYTLRHKEAFLATQLSLTKNYITPKGILHDTEKLVLYGLMESEEAHALHEKTSIHHWGNCETDEDFCDLVIDYECARFTKPDKPLNAYETIHKFRPEAYEKLKPFLEGYNINDENRRDIDFSSWNYINKIWIENFIFMNKEYIRIFYNNCLRNGIEKAVKEFNDMLSTDYKDFHYFIL